MIDANQLRRIRQYELHTSQERAAAALGVSLRTYARWEKNGPPLRAAQHVELLRKSIKHS